MAEAKEEAKEEDSAAMAAAAAKEEAKEEDSVVVMAEAMAADSAAD